MKGYLVPLLAAFTFFAIAFLALDFTIMKLHGLTLIYHH
jgi:hypothetical protein